MGLYQGTLADRGVVNDRPRVINPAWCWEIISSPDTSLIGRLFRLVDINSGGWETGTVFRHNRTWQTKIIKR